MSVHVDTPFPIELTAPDISAYRGNTDVDYFTTLDSKVPGPHVMVTAVVHGNEICGAIALDHFFKSGLRPRAGRLTLGFCNVAAFLSFNPKDPTRSRYIDEDFNRLWDEATLDGPRTSQELSRARAVRPILADADYLLDIHSMLKKSDALTLSGPLAKGRTLAKGVGAPSIVVSDHGHAAGRRMRDYVDFINPDSPKNALLVECGQHWEQDSATVAIDTMYRFLHHTGTLDADDVAAHIANTPKPQRFIEVSGPVTIQTDQFRFVKEFNSFDVVEKAGTVIAHDGPHDVMTPYDDCVLIMPTKRAIKGISAVRLGQYIDA